MNCNCKNQINSSELSRWLQGFWKCLVLNPNFQGKIGRFVPTLRTPMSLAYYVKYKREHYNNFVFRSDWKTFQERIYFDQVILFVASNIFCNGMKTCFSVYFFCKFLCLCEFDKSLRGLISFSLAFFCRLTLFIPVLVRGSTLKL